MGRGCRGCSAGCPFAGSTASSPHAAPRVNPEPPCRRPRLRAAGCPARSTREVVNAPASPSEVTWPAAGPGGSPGEWAQGARQAVLPPRPWAPRSPSRRFPGTGGGGRGSGVVSRTRGLVLSNRILFASAGPELPGSRQGRGWDCPRGRWCWERTWVTPAPLSFVGSGRRGSPRCLPKTPGRGEGSSGEWGLGSWVSGRCGLGWDSAFGSRGCCEPRGHALRRLQSSRVSREEIPTWELGRRWEQEAGSPLQLLFCAFQPPVPANPGPSARCVGARRPSPRPKPGARCVLARAELGPALPESQARLKLGGAPFGLAAPQNARPRAGGRRKPANARPGRRQSAGRPHPGVRLPRNGGGASLPGWLFVLNGTEGGGRREDSDCLKDL